MLVTIVVLFFIFVLAFLYGIAVIHGLKKLFHVNGNDSISQILLIGIATLTIIAMAVNLFIPLSVVFFSLLLMGVIVIVFQKQFFESIVLPNYHALTRIVLVVIFIAILENATHVPTNPDTGLYHGQIIRWFEEYRIVPGLGNLHARLAFNSSWLVLNAALSLAFLHIQSFHLVGAALFFASIICFIDGLDALLQKKISVSSILKVFFLLLSFYLLGSDISSPGTDMPVSLIIWCIIVMWIEMLETQRQMKMQEIILFILCLFAVTVKLAAAPLGILALFIIVERLKKKEWKELSLLALLGVVILLPWMVRSVILSGYLVFPVSQVDLFNVDWKMISSQVTDVQKGIIGFARFQKSNWQDALDMNIMQWLPIWLERQTLNRKLIYTFVLFSPVIMIFNLYKYPVSRSLKYLLPYLTCMMGVIFWLFTAPDIRFGYGFLMGACLLPLPPLLLNLHLRWDKSLNVTPALVFIVLFGFYLMTVALSFDTPTIKQRWLLPADYSPSKAQLCSISNGLMYCQRESSQCNYDAFPCVPNPRPNVEMRGSSFQDGFRVKPQTSNGND